MPIWWLTPRFARSFVKFVEKGTNKKLRFMIISCQFTKRKRPSSAPMNLVTKPMHSNMTCSHILESIQGKNPINVSNVVSGTDFLYRNFMRHFFRFPTKSGYFLNHEKFLGIQIFKGLQNFWRLKIFWGLKNFEG